MIKHKQNISSRIIYFIIIFFIYRQCFIFGRLSLNLAMYSMFLFLLFIYYILNIINFDEKFKGRDFFYSILANVVYSQIFYFFYKKVEIFLVFSIYTIFQIGINYVLHNNKSQKKNILAIGNIDCCKNIKDILKKSENYVFVGYVAEKKQEDELEYLGNIKQIKQIIKEKEIRGIVFSKESYVKRNSDILVKIKLRGIKIVDYFSFLEDFEGKIDNEKIDSMWILMSNSFNNSVYTLNTRVKRIMDLVIAIIFFFIFSPFMVVTYFLVKFDIGLKYIILNPVKIVKNPAFFIQNRIGYRGNVFKIIKFRSMKPHDPQKFSKYASEDDNRITKIGKFIRKTRLDELPQLINVIRGEMSFVGPRPEWDELGKKYEENIKNYTLRYAVQPGITGWAQTIYKYGVSEDDARIKLEYDLYYIKNQNLILDFIILFKTVKTILFSKGI